MHVWVDSSALSFRGRITNRSVLYSQLGGEELKLYPAYYRIETGVNFGDDYLLKWLYINLAVDAPWWLARSDLMVFVSKDNE